MPKHPSGLPSIASRREMPPGPPPDLAPWLLAAVDVMAPPSVLRERLLRVTAGERGALIEADQAAEEDFALPSRRLPLDARTSAKATLASTSAFASMIDPRWRRNFGTGSQRPGTIGQRPKTSGVRPLRSTVSFIDSTSNSNAAGRRAPWRSCGVSVRSGGSATDIRIERPLIECGVEIELEGRRSPLGSRYGSRAARRPQALRGDGLQQPRGSRRACASRDPPRRGRGRHLAVSFRQLRAAARGGGDAARRRGCVPARRGSASGRERTRDHGRLGVLCPAAVAARGPRRHRPLPGRGARRRGDRGIGQAARHGAGRGGADVLGTARQPSRGDRRGPGWTRGRSRLRRRLLPEAFQRGSGRHRGPPVEGRRPRGPGSARHGQDAHDREPRLPRPGDRAARAGRVARRSGPERSARSAPREGEAAHDRDPIERARRHAARSRRRSARSSRSSRRAAPRSGFRRSAAARPRS